MPAPSVHLHRLVALGLTSYEAKVYLALIQRESFAAAEVATVAQVPRQRVYDVLNSLVQRGLARGRPGPVTRYSATAPDAAVERLIAVQRGALSALEAESGTLAQDLAETWTDGRDETAPLDYVEILRDRSMLAERFVQVQQEAQFELLTFAKPPYALIGNPVGLEATRRITAAGGDVRCVYDETVLSDDRVLAAVAEFTEAGEQARVVAEVPMKLCITDGARALFALTDPVAGGLTSTNILVEHAAMAASLRMTFERLWDSGRSVAGALATTG
jgi:hypothetical protein